MSGPPIPFDPHYPSAAGAECPWPAFERLRLEQPIFQLPERPNIYMVTRYSDVRFAFANPHIFSSTNNRTGLNQTDALLGDAEAQATVMVETDSPDHKPKRDLVFPSVRPTVLKNYEATILEIVTDLIDGFIERGRCEFISEFSQELPLRLTLRLLGVPDDDMEWVRLWGLFEGSGLSWMPSEYQVEQRRRGEIMAEYLNQKVSERYETRGLDIISEVIDRQIARDGAFNPDEVRAQVGIFLAGGIVTTAHFIGSAMLLLVADRELMDSVTADLALLPKVINEGLRLEPPFMWMPRRVTQDVEMSGTRIPAGSHVILLIASANRDGEKFACPNEFRKDRPNGHEHVAFGFGPHFCLGAPIARMEARIALEQLLTRLSDVRLADGQELRHRPSPSFRGLESLHLEFTAA